jgi:hypothetical protein
MTRGSYDAWRETPAALKLEHLRCESIRLHALACAATEQNAAAFACRGNTAAYPLAQQIAFELGERCQPIYRGLGKSLSIINTA